MLKLGVKIAGIVCLLGAFRIAAAERVIVPVPGSPMGNAVSALLQDDDGFVWVGTVSGLMRYDMYSYRYFDDCDSIPGVRTMIRCLARDTAGNIWIGSETGAAVYDPAHERFRNVGGAIANLPVKTITPSASGAMLLTTGEGVAVVDAHTFACEYLPGSGKEFLNNILTTTADTSGNIWGWSHGRLSRFTFTSGSISPRIESFPFPYEVRAMAVDAFGRLWFNDRGRLLVTSLPSDPKNASPTLLKSGVEVRSIRIDKNEVLVTTSYDGIHRFRIEADGKITPGEVTWIDPVSHNEVCNSVLCTMTDRDGNIWYGTVDGIRVSCEKPREVFHNLSVGVGGLSHNVVSDIRLGPDGAVWAATSGGLDRIIRTTGGCNVEHFLPRLPVDGAERGNLRFQTLAFDREGMLWVGTKRTLLFFDPQERRFSDRPEITGFLTRHGAQFGKELHCDRQGNIWMGFIYGGLFVYDTHAGQCRTVRFSRTDLFDASVHTITEDKKGNIWLGTKTRGLLRFRPGDMTLRGDTAVVTRYDSYFPQERPASGLNSVNILYCTPAGDVYAGTSHGLYRYDAAQNLFREYPLNQVGGDAWALDMVGDRDGALWVSTVQGIYRFRPDDEQSPFYEISDGAFSRIDYNTGSCIDADGVIYMGGINGITYFDPREIGAADRSQKVYVSRISVLNEDIHPDERHLESDINRSHRLTLNYDDYQLSLEFTTLSFTPDSQPRYFYRIDGLTPDWIELVDGNRLSFSNLAHGEYTLRVKASDASGILGSESTDILITVLPPWWLTWWSYCIYALLALLIAATVVWIILIRYRAAQKVRMAQYKQQLFINLTHGLKTPLTMMQVPLQLMTCDTEQLSDEERRGLLAMVSANVKKLANTVRQLMEFRKIDQNRVTLNLAELDIVDYVSCICDYFRELFSQKGLALHCSLPAEPVVMAFDPEKIELALYNLLQNAYTFTPRGGEVTVTLAVKQGQVAIFVRDTGVGIRPEYLDKIFLRFWQVRESDTMPPMGAGIGLSVAREFVELHDGTISVESHYGEGSTFTVRLPLVADYPKDTYIHRAGQSDEEQILPVYTKQFAATDLYVENEPAVDESKTNTLYVVAGGGDITGLVRMVLPDFNVLHYNNVEDTLRAVRERRPQLILIDIVVYDREEGLALCRKIKGSRQTDDIPVVLLTADNSPEDARLFCELGVDSYMEKPFDVELFRARVRQLIDRHTDLQQKLKIGQILGKHDDIVVESADEKFMSRVMEIIEKNIAAEEFSLAEFAQEMRVSRSVLNMRIQTIAGKSPMELLRNARMQRAAQLLETNAYDIAQVSYLVGFSDPRYFSTSFKKQFGESPRAYMLRSRQA